MNISRHLNVFQQATAQLNKTLHKEKQLHAATGIYLESVFLKLYKLSWLNQTPDPLTAPSRIFFSIWINEKCMEESKLMYNIHALKLRQLKGYSITSRQFADDFRKAFKPFEKRWPNVSTSFGPLTLMEGWVKLDAASLADDVLKLARQFLEIDHLIDELLEKHRKD
ncbi:MAG: hypothetical protein ABIU63_16615 [Chitinophagaceae bacterium]